MSTLSVVRDWVGRSQHPPCCVPSSPHAFSFRNFRKHLRMVGSRRVKAQSKMGPGEVGTAVLGSLGFLANWALHVGSPPPSACSGPTYISPGTTSGWPVLPSPQLLPLSCVVLSISVSVLCLAPNSVEPHLGPT